MGADGQVGRDGALIELAGVAKTFALGPVRVRALEWVDLAVGRGELVGVMGPSGSGKTTLLHVIGCLMRPTSGRYVLDGRAVDSLDEFALAGVRNRNVGFVFQAFNLLPRFTALGNVELPLVYARVPARRRRARALVKRPSIILADEPTGNLDSASGRAIMDMLVELNRAGKTVIVVTHEQMIAERTDRVVHLLDGRVVSDETAGGAG